MEVRLGPALSRSAEMATSNWERKIGIFDYLRDIALVSPA
jgi:hypothetical protein